MQLIFWNVFHDKCNIFIWNHTSPFVYRLKPVSHTVKGCSCNSKYLFHKGTRTGFYKLTINSIIAARYECIYNQLTAQPLLLVNKGHFTMIHMAWISILSISWYIFTRRNVILRYDMLMSCIKVSQRLLRQMFCKWHKYYFVDQFHMNMIRLMLDIYMSELPIFIGKTTVVP